MGRELVRVARGIAAIGSILVLLPAGAEAAVAPAAVAEFCQSRVLYDYDAPLDGLPGVREPPQSGALPFAPTRVGFQANPGPNWGNPGAGENVVLAGDRITYWLRLSGKSFGSKRLDWQVRSRLVRVNREGEGRRVVKRKLQRVGTLRPPSGGELSPTVLGFARSPGPGLYRYDIVFRTSKGELLGRYSEHYRVVKRVEDLRIALLGNVFRVGDTVYARVENHGTVGADYGAGSEFERLENGTWVRPGFETLFGHPNIVPLIALFAIPGTQSDCSFNGFVVPSGMTPGMYRMVKLIGDYPVYAEFTVVP